MGADPMKPSARTVYPPPPTNWADHDWSLVPYLTDLLPGGSNCPRYEWMNAHEQMAVKLTEHVAEYKQGDVWWLMCRECPTKMGHSCPHIHEAIRTGGDYGLVGKFSLPFMVLQAPNDLAFMEVTLSTEYHRPELRLLNPRNPYAYVPLGPISPLAVTRQECCVILSEFLDAKAQEAHCTAPHHTGKRKFSEWSRTTWHRNALSMLLYELDQGTIEWDFPNGGTCMDCQDVFVDI